VLDFINHSSFKLSSGDVTLLTDPWYVSSAFGSWLQYPSPRAEDVFNLVGETGEFAVVISHGHDDHLDEAFIRWHLAGKKFFCPKFATPGLENRLKKRCGVEVQTIGSEVKFGPYTISQFINPEFTNYDAVIVIRTADYAVIHANDNWHLWPSDMLEEIADLVRPYGEDRIFFLAQFGIADAFPVSYPQYGAAEKLEVVYARFRRYRDETLANMEGLGIGHIYYYANQSKCAYRSEVCQGFYDEAQKFIAGSGDKRLAQLSPGATLYVGHRVVTPVDPGVDFFDYRLGALEFFLNKEFARQSRVPVSLKIRLLARQEDVDFDCVNYISDEITWSRILCGELTLEAIIVGGSGAIYKPDVNIQQHHRFVSKQAYVIQNLIAQNGLKFFAEYQR